MRVFNVGVIGCGQIAQIMHLPYLRELPGFKIGALCDVSKRTVEAVGEQYGVARRYLDYRELLAQEDIDIALVLTKDHADVVVHAANAGKHVLTEKPMCFNLEEADRIIAAARENQVKVMVGYMKCFDPGFEWALERFKRLENLRLIRMHDFAGNSVVNREIYDLHYADDIPADIIAASEEKVRASMLKAIGPERAHLLDAYGQLLGLCSHDAAILRRAFGDPEQVLYADAYEKLWVMAVLRYGDGTRCLWECGAATSRKGWDETLTAYACDATVEVQFPFPYLRNAATMVNVTEMEGEAIVQKSILASYDEAFKREWRHFYRCIVKDLEPITNAEQGKADIALLIEIIRKVGCGA